MNWMNEVRDFMPHGMCLLWRPELMALHILSDGLIAAAYFAIPVCIARFVRGRKDLDRGHRALALLFAAFIGLCGLTHVVSIVVLWQPIYITGGWLKALTAVVSVMTAVVLWRLVPQLLTIPSTRALQREIEAHRKTVEQLDAARAALALRVDHTEGELRSAVRHQEQSDALVKTIVEAAPGLIYAKDPEGRMLLANRAALDLIGKAWPEVEGRTDREFLSDPLQGETVMRHDRMIMAGGKAQEFEEVVDHPGKGARVWLSTKTPMHDADGAVTGLVGLSFDITERKQLEARLRHDSRLSAMGEMAAALAHELNQPLGSIVNYVGGCRAIVARDQPDSPLLVHFDKAIEESLRAGQIIRRLRSFVSGDANIRQVEILPALVDEACAFALVGASADASLTTAHDRPDLQVSIDRVQIEQVIHNLVRNALDSAAAGTAPVLRATTAAIEPGMVQVSIADNGTGIDPDIAERLFTPFVSSKGPRGMGVGLSICRTIIEAHRGRIWAEARPEGGTVFHFTLPLAPAGEDER
ncbi:MAG: two-component system sensor histidine kinase NtrB [Brevundimonas sp.]